MSGEAGVSSDIVADNEGMRIVVIWIELRWSDL